MWWDVMERKRWPADTCAASWHVQHSFIHEESLCISITSLLKWSQADIQTIYTELLAWMFHDRFAQTLVPNEANRLQIEQMKRWEKKRWPVRWKRAPAVRFSCAIWQRLSPWIRLLHATSCLPQLRPSDTNVTRHKTIIRGHTEKEYLSTISPWKTTRLPASIPTFAGS